MERHIHIQTGDKVENEAELTSELKARIEELTQALIDAGIIASEDEIRVLVGHDGNLPKGVLGRQIEVEHIYGDGDHGPVDVVSEKYTVDF